MRKAAGILFIAPDSTALFLKRGNGGDHANEFCFPGGTTESGETALQTAERETIEEIGFLPEGKRKLWTRRIKADQIVSVITPAQELGAAPVAPPPNPMPTEEVDFTTFICHVAKKFDVTTNGEHTGWGWFSVDAPPEPLHPGCRVALARLKMNELGVATAMMNGDLTSPQFYKNMTLFDLRVTGTGFSYRPKLKEFVYRRPEDYLTQEFLGRCAGLPVIIVHPIKATLDSKEFSERIIGTMMLPYIKGDEVWGISKIFDDDAVIALSDKVLSTSPGVVLTTSTRKINLEDGETLLLETKPSLLDHLAICEHGVWDKGEGPSGVNSTSAKDKAMAVKTKEEIELEEAEIARKDAAEVEEKARKDAEESNIDRVLKCVDSVSTRLDSMMTRMDAADEERKTDRARMDSMEAARKDAMPAELKEKAEEKKEEARADSTELSARVDDIAARTLELASRTPLQLSDEDHAQFSQVQARADDVFGSFGSTAPRALNGETIIAYRRRLLGKLQAHSPTWKDVDLLKINDSTAFSVAETQILGDALKAAEAPVDLAEDELRPIVRRDSTGRSITTFHGQPRAWMDSFAAPRRYLTGINKTQNNA